jgi:hypothetical protein
MLEAILKKILTNWALKRAEKKDKEFIENYTPEETEEGVVFKGRELNFLENLAAAKRLVGNMYKMVSASYTLYYDTYIYLNNYKKEGLRISYAQLAECKRNGKFSYRKGRGIVTLKLEDKKKYLMYVCGSDTDRAKEPEITAQIAAFLEEKCGTKIV